MWQKTKIDTKRPGVALFNKQVTVNIGNEIMLRPNLWQMVPVEVDVAGDLVPGAAGRGDVGEALDFGQSCTSVRKPEVEKNDQWPIL